MNDKLMLEETETLAMLRAGRTGAEPPLHDVTGTAVRAGHRMRVRRHVLAAGSGVAALGLTAVAVVTGVPGLSLGDGSAVIAPAGPVNDPAARAADQRAQQADLNREQVAAALGPSFIAGLGQIGLRPGSEAANSLPAGYRAGANVDVAPDDTQLTANSAPSPAARPAGGCAPVKVGKRTVEVRTFPQQGIGSTAAGPDLYSVPVSTLVAHFVRPSGETVSVSLLASEDSSDPRLATAPGPSDLDPAARAEAALDWLTAQTDAVAKTATLAGIRATDPADERAMPNEEVLAQALGGSFSVDGDRVVLDPDGQAAGPLPGGSTATATLRFLGGEAERAALCGQGCERDVLPGGRLVWTQTRADRVDSERAVLGDATVYFVQPDGEVVRVQLLVRGPESGLERVEIQRETFLTWLESFRSALIAAATDARGTGAGTGG